ncbi:MAG TPA: IDEAL domain-containing protein [Bacillus bacterium]|nr:IDEAL domain-containing protein [Bacillus sp. (in: firmicutes)]
MENRKSYAAQKNSHSDFNNADTNYVFDVYIQMIIDEALYNYKKDLLLKQINDALDARDRTQFYLLTEQYKRLIENQT